jgi:hypothetical protein
MPCDFKGTVYQQKLNRTLYAVLDRTIQTLFFINLERKNLLSTYIENTQNGEKVLKLSKSWLRSEHHEEKLYLRSSL